MTTVEIKQARLAYLTEKVAYFEADTSRRAIDNNERCYYRTTDGERKCMIGLDIPDDKYYPSLEENNVLCDKVFSVVPLNIQKLGPGFLQVCQQLHDKEAYWDANGLSEKGSKQLEHIKQKYIYSDEG